MKYRLIIPLILSFFIFTSCSSTQVRPIKFKNYSIGKVRKVNIGNKMIVNRDGHEVETKEWVGLAFSSDGYKTTKYMSDESFQEELIYTGRIDDELHISYKEYKRDLARPAFFQDLVYDLGRSNVVVYKQYKLLIKDATNEYIIFQVVRD